MRVILASGSPRRREILARIAYPFEVRPSNVDETRHASESPAEYVARVSRDKVLAVARDAPGDLVLGADTSVVLGDRTLGKPEDANAAREMLASLSGRTHEVLTGVAVARGGRLERDWVTSSRVRFRQLSSSEVDAYVATGDAFDKAGGYGVQSGADAFVEGVEGSVTSVIGLPFEETEVVLRELGARMDPDAFQSTEAIALRFRAVSGEVAALAVAHGRRAGSARLVSVTKGHGPDKAAALVEAGACDLGENYMQEARAKLAALGEVPGVRWHMIGALQRNKAAAISEYFDVVHTIDRPEVAAAISRRRPEGKAPIEALLQVNVARDAAKAGIAPEEVSTLLGAIGENPGLVVVGLMTIGHAAASPTEAAGVFAELRELRDSLRAQGHERLIELSMGMSQDYPQAIEQGATMVRLGTTILGPRAPRKEKRET